MKRFLLFCLLFLFTVQVSAEVPKLFNYSGKLTDKNGNLLPDAQYDMEFSLWDHLTDTDLSHRVWVEDHSSGIPDRSVPVRGSGFNVALGGISPLPDFSEKLWIQITVRIESVNQTFSRSEILSSPYTIRAEYANQADTIADNAVTSGKISDGEVRSEDIANDAIDATKIKDRSIGTLDIAMGSIGWGEVQDNAINTQAKAPWAPKAYINGVERNFPKIACGRSDTNSIGIATIDLSSYGFTQPPMVVCSPVHGSSQVSVTIFDSVTANSFSVCTRYNNDAGYATWFYWIAIGY